MISVIVPLQNEEKSIEAKLIALHRIDPGAEMIVVHTGEQKFFTEYATGCLGRILETLDELEIADNVP